MNTNRRQELIGDLYKSAYGEEWDNGRNPKQRSEYDEGTGTLYIKGENFDVENAQAAIRQIEKHIERIKEVARPENTRKIKLYNLAIICIKRQFNIPVQQPTTKVVGLRS